MSDSDNEMLLVLRPGEDSARSLSGIDVVHQISPAVRIVRKPSGRAHELAGPEVLYAGSDPSPAVLSSLDQTERLFVEGWLARRNRAPKKRPHDGVAWDAEGLLPPDLPPSRRSDGELAE